MTNTVCRHIIYKLKPNAEQERMMQLHCKVSGDLYNYLLSYSIEVRKTGVSFPTMFDLVRAARAYRMDNEWMLPTYANCLNMVAKNLKTAIENYFSRKKCGLKAGFPRYKTEKDMDSFGYPDRFRFATAKDKLNSLKFIKLPKVGFVRYHNDYKLPGRMVSATVFYRNEGTKPSWYVRILYEMKEYENRELRMESESKSSVGIDLGLVTRVAFSDGESIPVNSVYLNMEEKIGKESKKLAKLEKGSKEYVKQRGKIGRLYKKAHNIVNYENHKLSKYVAFRNEIVFMEDLQTEVMISKAYSSERRKLYRDASWGELTKKIQYKAADAGNEVIFVNPMNTSQICSNCGSFVPKEQTERTHRCHVCGFVEDRDVNAAINIHKVGLRLQAGGKMPESLEDWQSLCTDQGRDLNPHESGKKYVDTGGDNMI